MSEFNAFDIIENLSEEEIISLYEDTIDTELIAGCKSGDTETGFKYVTSYTCVSVCADGYYKQPYTGTSTSCPK